MTGLPILSNTTKLILNRIVLLQKKDACPVSYSGYNDSISPIFKNLNILQLNDQYGYQLTSLLWDLGHDTLPPSIGSYFNKINKTHSHDTRQATANEYKVNRANTLYAKINFR